MAMEFLTRPLVIDCTHAEEDGWYRSPLVPALGHDGANISGRDRVSELPWTMI